jgi:hypothetical protein
MEKSSDITIMIMEATRSLTTASRFSCQTSPSRSPTAHRLALTLTRHLHRYSGNLHSKRRQTHHRLASPRPAILGLLQAEGKRLEHRLAHPPRPSLRHSTSWVVVKLHQSRNRLSARRQARHQTHSPDSVSRRARLSHQVPLANLSSLRRRTVQVLDLEGSTSQQQRTTSRNRPGQPRQPLRSASQSRARLTPCSVNLQSQLDRLCHL